MPRTHNLRQSYKWINFTQFLDRKTGDIKIVATQKFCSLIVISLNVLVIIQKQRFATMVMSSLLQKLFTARKLTFFKFKLFSQEEQSFRDYTVFFAVLRFCDIAKLGFQMFLFLPNFVGIFQRRINLIMAQNIISFSLPLQKLNVTNAYIKVILIDKWQCQ